MTVKTTLSFINAYKNKSHCYPNSKHPRVEKDLLGGLNVFVKAPALEGKANKAALEALAEHFAVAKSRVQLVRGEKSKLKIFRII